MKDVFGIELEDGSHYISSIYRTDTELESSIIARDEETTGDSSIIFNYLKNLNSIQDRFTYNYNIVDDESNRVSTITFSPLTALIYVISMIYFWLFETDNFSVQEIVIAQLLNGFRTIPGLYNFAQDNWQLSK